ncbi:MAG: hypothetical protein RMH84_06550 [Sulfolobales archaeon]|nr:hypothetical protein [Sulfolobales archaeon]MCX8208221.1 hypothetical protein [Sulfolobales archaeon]MDW8011231.1 hypothetical protein [Sulfolobales archaeon]
MNRVKKLLDAMYAKLFTPGDIVVATGLPRYEVLAALHVFEELGIVEPLVSKGNYRVYRLTKLGEKLYRALEVSDGIAIDIVGAAPRAESSSTREVAESSS